jgi:hypothetical protein
MHQAKKGFILFKFLRRIFMKRFITILVVVAFVAAIPLSHGLMAKNPKEKVLVCHVTKVNDAGDRFEGKVIDISVNALPAHCAHGDHHPKNKVKGDDCSRSIDNYGQKVNCAGEKPVYPHWYK